MSRNLLRVLGLFLVAICISGCSTSKQSSYAKPTWIDDPAAPAEAAPQRVYGASSNPNAVSRIYPCGDCGDMRLDKTMPEQVQMNTPFSYAIMVTNDTSMTARNVVVREHAAGHFKLTKASPSAVDDGGVLAWTFASIPPGASRVIDIEGVATDVGPVMQCATMDFVIPVCAQANVVVPQITLTKTASEVVTVCDEITQTLVVANTGTGPARNVMVKEMLPPGLTTLDGKSQVLFTAGTLNPGESRRFTATLKAPRAGEYAHKAVATADGGLQAYSSPVTTVVTQPILRITKSGPERRYLGRPVNYLITIANEGSGTATDIAMEDAIPRGMEFVSANHLGVARQGKVIWSLPDLPPGDSHLVEVTFRADSEGTFTNQATVRATCVDPVSASAQTTVRGIPAVLLEVIDVEDPIELGSYETYIITTTNQGTTASTGVSIACMLEDNVEYYSSGGPTTATVRGRTVTFAPLASLAPKQKATWKVVVKAVRAGDVRFRVVMNTDQLQRPVEESESTEMYE